jgi:uncharacterized protein YqjF (DUF2071 family)
MLIGIKISCVWSTRADQIPEMDESYEIIFKKCDVIHGKCIQRTGDADIIQRPGVDLTLSLPQSPVHPCT